MISGFQMKPTFFGMVMLTTRTGRLGESENPHKVQISTDSVFVPAFKKVCSMGNHLEACHD